MTDTTGGGAGELGHRPKVPRVADARRSWRTVLLRSVALAVLYVLGARSALWLGDLSTLGAVFWPSAGIVVTALLVAPRRQWPALLAAVAVAELGNDLALGFPVVAAAWWAAANVVVGGSVAWALQRWRAEQLDRADHVLRFVVVVLTVPALGAALGAVGTLATGTAVGYPTIVGQWIIGDGLGILALTPLGLLLCRRELRVEIRTDRRVEAAFAALVLVGTTLFVFGLGPDALTGAPIAYLVLLPVLWSAARFGFAGAAIAVPTVALLANPATAFGHGPFANAPLGSIGSSALLQLFLATTAVAALIVASRTVESERYQHLAQTRAQLLSVVSHELRTPLTPILGFSELLMRAPERHDVRSEQAAAVIHRNSLHLAAVIEDLLSLTRSRRGGPVPHPVDLELGGFLRQLLEERPDMAAELEVPSDAAEAHVDPTHLTQIVVNLLANAARYGRPPVRLVVTPRPAAIDLTVTDEGDGVPHWFEPSLFEDFAQATVGDRRPSLGLGLGLPIARDLARANGGDLTYDRSPTGGARFTVRLAHVAAASPDTGTPTSDRGAATEVGPTPG